ncbi:MAG: hypothetical protein GTN40_04635 [Candidatus Aenigmarchaeota archaeon]|nr:hypothetical protein [Candidatus Aenigmarchaeota archaeon]
MKRILNIAHRGASAYEPENTLWAFKRAIEMGADIIELDVRKSADGYLVVFHDSTTLRFNGKSHKISNLSLSELKKIKLPKGEKISTLKEVFNFLKGKVGIVIEIKVKGIEKEVIDLVKEFNLKDKVIISSFIPEMVRKIKKIDNSFKTGIIWGLKEYKKNLITSTKSQLKTLKEVRADFLFPLFIFVRKSMVKKIKDSGFKIIPWTINSELIAKRLVDWGIDGIISNKPDMVRKILAKKAKSE